jgi:peroxiredoxin
MAQKFLNLVIFILFLTFFQTIKAQSEDRFTAVEVGKSAPIFTVRTLDGKAIDLDKLKGKVILLNFFATWCRPCMEEMPHIEQLQKRYGNSDLVIISIGREHQLAELEIFNQTKGFTFNIAADPDRKIFEMYAEKMIPRNYVIDRRGFLSFQNSGFNHDDFSKMVEAIEKELKKK